MSNNLPAPGHLDAEPLVSVIIVGRNVDAYVRETVESALAQTWKAREVIVVDDGSSDRTRAVLESFGDRIRTIFQPPIGLGAGRNAALAVARGEYVALLDADDLWLPEKLEAQVGIARAHPESGLIGCDGEEFGSASTPRKRLLSVPLRKLVDESSDGVVTGRFHEQFIFASPFSCPAQTLIPRRIIDRLGPFAELWQQDYEYYLRIAREYPVTVHRDSLARWRYRSEGMSGPEAYRMIEWALGDQPVLTVHGRRCNAREQALVMQRRREQARNVVTRALALSKSGESDYAMKALRRLLREGPWPPIALPYVLWIRATRMFSARRVSG